MGRRTPLYDRHVAAGARMVDFAGYDMPLQYSGIRDEHVAVRERAGIFDVSHMGEVGVRGPGAADFVQRLVTNDVARLAPNQLLYSVMCNEQGGIVDDVIVMRVVAADHYIIVVNASTREKDVAWMREHAPRRRRAGRPQRRAGADRGAGTTRRRHPRAARAHGR